MNLLDNGPRAGHIHVAVLEGVVGRDRVNLTFPAYAAQPIAEEHRIFDLGDFLAFRAAGEWPAIAALQVGRVQRNQPVDGLHAVESRPAGVRSAG
ncbi:hypothetical protein D3C78_1448780 [compost metagenome]